MEYHGLQDVARGFSPDFPSFHSLLCANPATAPFCKNVPEAGWVHDSKFLESYTIFCTSGKHSFQFLLIVVSLLLLLSFWDLVSSVRLILSTKACCVTAALWGRLTWVLALCCYCGCTDDWILSLLNERSLESWNIGIHWKVTWT